MVEWKHKQVHYIIDAGVAYDQGPVTVWTCHNLCQVLVIHY